MIDFSELDRFVVVLTRAGIAPALVPLGPNKHPLVRWRGWPAGRIGDLRHTYRVPTVRVRPSQVRELLNGPRLTAGGPIEPIQPTEWIDVLPEGAGLLTGARSGGLVVIDVDANPNPALDGFRTLERLELAHGPIPSTLTVRSPSGGLHLYLIGGAERYQTQARKLGPGVDVRGEGGLVVVPGSRHARTGGTYRMESPTP